MGHVERHFRAKSSGEEECVKRTNIVNLADRWHCLERAGGGSSGRGKQVVYVRGGGLLPVGYSQYTTTAQLYCGSEVTRGDACRSTLRANNCETYSDLRTCDHVCVVYFELSPNSYYISEFVLQIDKVSTHCLYVLIDCWERCDGSKYYYNHVIVVVLTMPQCQSTES